MAGVRLPSLQFWDFSGMLQVKAWLVSLALVFPIKKPGTSHQAFTL
jgi:hypothetical protein